ncbi:TIGR00282 family metallophosphoesterase [candidate division KSB1 bacterium]|nr:MAG: TIGR00282 family metallophosphoesterase [candidate division KSB1 bacterium]
MNYSKLNILFIADVVGSEGFDAVASTINKVKEKYDIHFTVLNGENSASGKGLLKKNAESFFSLGIDVITSGNHIWNKKEIYSFLDSNKDVLRPANYPEMCPGTGIRIKETANGIPVAVLNLQGRSFMYPIDCPFQTADMHIENLKKSGIKVIFIDFHAEATAEKVALGWYVDGKVSAVVGTHTHVQTADNRILPNGTAYITDAGMTGSLNSVIGMDIDTAIKRFLTQMPVYYKTAKGNPVFCGVVVSINALTGRALSIKRIWIDIDKHSIS